VVCIEEHKTSIITRTRPTSIASRPRRRRRAIDARDARERARMRRAMRAMARVMTMDVVCSSRGVTRAGDAVRVDARAYASGGKKAASKSRANQGKRAKGKGPVAVAISANAESTTKTNKETYLSAIAPAARVWEEEAPLSAEELEAYAEKAKAYSREKMRADRAFQKDINEKIRIKKAAIMALPEGAVRDAALVQDDDLFPLKRKLPSYTPAIPGYYEEKQRLAEEAVGGGAAFKR